MNIFTTISPSHINFDSQQRAIQSWIALGLNVYSVNRYSEIEELKKHFKGVTFIESNRTMFSMFGKHLIPFDTMIEASKSVEGDIVCLINSDIELISDKGKIEKLYKKAESGLCIVSRYNYEEVKEINTLEKFGLDIFCFHKKFSHIFPSSNLTVGKPLWDYWISYWFAINDLPLYSIHDRIAFHKTHKLQWNRQDKIELGKEFRKLPRFTHLEQKKLSPAIRSVIIQGIKETITEL